MLLILGCLSVIKQLNICTIKSNTDEADQKPAAVQRKEKGLEKTKLNMARLEQPADTQETVVRRPQHKQWLCSVNSSQPEVISLMEVELWTQCQLKPSGVSLGHISQKASSTLKCLLRRTLSPASSSC